MSTTLAMILKLGDKMIGKFIAFEGIDGCGKTSIIKQLQKEMGEENTLIVRAPGGTVVGQELRKILLSPNNSLDRWPIFYLFVADFLHTYVEVIEPAVCEGKTVLCDRWKYSTFAYQLYAQVDEYNKLKLAKEVLKTMVQSPDITFFIDLPVEICQSRLAKVALEFEILDKFEKSELEIKRKRREGFLRAEFEVGFGTKWQKIKSDGESVEELTAKIKSYLEELV